MIHTLAFLLTVAAAANIQDASFQTAAQEQVSAFVANQLWGHYDVLTVTILEAGESQTGADDLRRDYAFRSVLARFDAQRNEHWSESLNQNIPAAICDSEAELFLACRPPGYRFFGTLSIDMVLTVEGWKILSRHHNSLQAYPLADYLLCDPDPENTDVDSAIIRACFAGSPHPSLQRMPPSALLFVDPQRVWAHHEHRDRPPKSG